MSGQPAESAPQLCDHCHRRRAAYVLDRIGDALSGPAAQFPVWACEDCVPQLVDQVLQAVSLATVCRADSYRS